MNRGKFQMRRLSQLSPAFQTFVKETYGKMGQVVPEWVHIDLDKLKQEVGGKNQAFQEYFSKNGVPPERFSTVAFKS